MRVKDFNVSGKICRTLYKEKVRDVGERFQCFWKNL